MTNGDGDSGSCVRLVLFDQSALRAMLDGDLNRASAHVGVRLPTDFLAYDWLWAIRLAQVERNALAAPWLVRAVVTVPDEVVVGHAGFHGPPDERGMVEIGYTVLPEHRRRGYARAAVRELIRFAEGEANAQVIRASISPDNAASLAVIRPFGFERVGEQWDDEDGLELVFERPLHSEG